MQELKLTTFFVLYSTLMAARCPDEIISQPIYNFHGLSLGINSNLTAVKVEKLIKPKLPTYSVGFVVIGRQTVASCGMAFSIAKNLKDTAKCNFTLNWMDHLFYLPIVSELEHTVTELFTIRVEQKGTFNNTFKHIYFGDPLKRRVHTEESNPCFAVFDKNIHFVVIFDQLAIDNCGPISLDMPKGYQVKSVYLKDGTSCYIKPQVDVSDKIGFKHQHDEGEEMHDFFSEKESSSPLWLIILIICFIIILLILILILCIYKRKRDEAKAKAEAEAKSKVIEVTGSDEETGSDSSDGDKKGAAARVAKRGKVDYQEKTAYDVPEDILERGFSKEHQRENEDKPKIRKK